MEHCAILKSAELCAKALAAAHKVSSFNLRPITCYVEIFFSWLINFVAWWRLVPADDTADALLLLDEALSPFIGNLAEIRAPSVEAAVYRVPIPAEFQGNGRRSINVSLAYVPPVK
jgi:hypothetical protein